MLEINVGLFLEFSVLFWSFYFIFIAWHPFSSWTVVPQKRNLAIISQNTAVPFKTQSASSQLNKLLQNV